ncbi:hypothetical protein MYSE111917_25400 [Mycobacterium senriense]|uniref:Uncharacterized protein n=1 Tax=Mycobacterium senriense TaxID=2775496 RepID=A0ABN6ICR7_9MYCO|nr:hypothetical protein [Mycobacterium senriense]BCZ21365.1 hypothetical protein MTY59_12200 [Mycobacterium senriense]
MTAKELRVTARGRCGTDSYRAAKHSSVHAITETGQYWAVDAKVRRSNDDRPRMGSIVRFWSTEGDANADAARINAGECVYKQDTTRPCYDAVVTRATAYRS